MLPLLLVVLGALATARLTRLATADYLTQPVRRRVLQAVQEGGHLEYLISCRWCASIWIAVPVAAMVLALAPALRPDPVTGLVVAFLLVLAYSQVTGQLAAAEVEV